MCPSALLGGKAIDSCLSWNRKSTFDEQADHPGRYRAASAVCRMPGVPRHALLWLGILRHGVRLMPYAVDFAHAAPASIADCTRRSVRTRRQRATAVLDGIRKCRRPPFLGAVLDVLGEPRTYRKPISPSGSTRPANARGERSAAGAPAPFPWAGDRRTWRSATPGPRPRPGPCPSRP